MLSDQQYVKISRREQLNRVESREEILDLEKLIARHRVEYLIAENEDLRSTLDNRDRHLEELEAKILELERRLSNHQPHSIVETYLGRNRNSEEQMKKAMDLETSNKAKTELMRKLSNELAEMKQKSERQSKELTDVQGKWNRVKSEKDRLKKDMAKEIQDLVEAKKGLMGSLDDCKTRLEEYKVEVDRLTVTKEETIRCCMFWTSRSLELMNRLNTVSKKKEDMKKLSQDSDKTNDEYFWWVDYYWLSQHLSTAFDAIQVMRSQSDPEEWLNLNLATLREKKKSFEDYLKYMERKRQEGKEWIQKELESKYFETFEKLVQEKRRQ